MSFAKALNKTKAINVNYFKLDIENHVQIERISLITNTFQFVKGNMLYNGVCLFWLLFPVSNHSAGSRHSNVMNK